MKPIFFSSCFEDPRRHRLRLRDRVLAMTGGESDAARAARPIWMAEDYPDLSPASPWPQIEKAEFCVDGVRAAECFVAVIGGRHGSAMQFDPAGEVPSSFFEAELFEAALLGKFSFVFLLEGYELEPKLKNLLAALKPFFPNMQLAPVSEDFIVREIDRLISHYQRPRWLRKILSRPDLGSMVATLFRTRHRTYDVRSEGPPIRFLGGMFDSALPRPNRSVVQGVLDQAIRAPRNQTRLLYLWFALRALMGAPYNRGETADLLDLWRIAFDAWVSAGAWYGLHGHTAMGCLAALGSVTDVRLRLPGHDPLRAIPHGPLASEYYSIARLAGRSRELLKLSFDHAEASIATSIGDISGSLAIRGSIRRELGDLAAAIDDYQRVVDLRRDAGGPPLGDAQSELGFALLLSGSRARGVELMELGLTLMRERPADGFQIRAMRKLAVGYARTGKLVRALDLAVEAHETANRIGALDQIRWLERVAKQIDRVRRRSRSWPG